MKATIHTLLTSTAILALSACTPAPQSTASTASTYLTLEPAAGSYASPPPSTPIYSVPAH